MLQNVFIQGLFHIIDVALDAVPVTHLYKKKQYKQKQNYIDTHNKINNNSLHKRKSSPYCRLKRGFMGKQRLFLNLYIRENRIFVFPMNRFDVHFAHDFVLTTSHTIST